MDDKKLVSLDIFEMGYLLDACIRGSHLRSDTIRRFVDDYVSWWIYETDYGKCENMTENSWIEDGQEKSVNLITPETLYVFLQENARHSDSNEPTASGSNTKTISMEEFMQIAEKQILGNKYTTYFIR